MLVTLEEADIPGVVRPKEGRALVTVFKGLTTVQRNEVWKVTDKHRQPPTSIR